MGVVLSPIADFDPESASDETFIVQDETNELYIAGYGDNKWFDSETEEEISGVVGFAGPITLIAVEASAPSESAEEATGAPVASEGEATEAEAA